ncbi:hypothetical protein D3C72_2207530 [compost metagenome]
MTQVGAGQVGAGEVHLSQVLVGQVGPAQVGAWAATLRGDAAAVDGQVAVVGQGRAAGQKQG